MQPNLLTIKVNFGFFFDGKIVIKIEDRLNSNLARLYIQKWLQHFFKNISINFKCKDGPPQSPTNANIVPCENKQI
jgi:hypothetical protein